jgi:hypothetical protein
MMMFRRLYWVAEQLDQKGCSKVTGVYTSIQDLIQKGLHWCADVDGQSYRLTLVKPDSFNSPLGVWQSPSFEGLANALQEFVETNEYSQEECMMLQNELNQFMHQEAKAS